MDLFLNTPRTPFYASMLLCEPQNARFSKQDFPITPSPTPALHNYLPFFTMQTPTPPSEPPPPPFLSRTYVPPPNLPTHAQPSTQIAHQASERDRVHEREICGKIRRRIEMRRNESIDKRVWGGGIDVKLCGCVGDEKIRDEMGGLH